MKELAKVVSNHILTEAEAEETLQQILSGAWTIPQASALLTIINLRGLHLSELRGFHRYLRTNSVALSLSLSDASEIDVCGTGGDGKHTFNISTLAAFVLAGAGVKVAKHGNSSATSGCGSSDVLQFLGLKFGDDETVLRGQLERYNFCYLHAPLFQPLLKNVANLRREIGFRTFFNLLGVLLNPMQPKCQLIGVAEPSVLRLYRYFLEDSNVNFALVHTRDGYDEISLTAAFDVITNRNSETFYPEDLGFQTVAPSELETGRTVETAARDFLEILRGAGTSAQTNVVIANAAVAMQTARSQLDFQQCRALCETSLRSGAAFENFEKLLREQLK